MRDSLFFFLVFAELQNSVTLRFSFSAYCSMQLMCTWPKNMGRWIPVKKPNEMQSVGRKFFFVSQLRVLCMIFKRNIAINFGRRMFSLKTNKISADESSMLGGY
jgi:hypothetical protein